MRAGTDAAITAFTIATTLVTLAAFVAPGLARRSGRASRIVIASLTWNSLVIAPIYALGLTDRLYAGPLAGLVSTVSALVLLYACLRMGTGLALREIGRTAATFVRLPIDAMRIAVAEGSFAMVVVPIAFGFSVWLTAQAVLAPTWGDWDCLWYHEPMIGFAIQNHGFAMVPLEPYAQKINGYPRLSEMTMLWFGMYHGRWAIDLVNPLFLPLYAVSTYAIGRDLGAVRSTAMGFGAAMLLVPGVVRLIPTTMVDPHAAALCIAACFFACRREFDLRDAFFAIVAVTLAMGSKTFLLVPGFFVCVTLLVRILRRGRAFGAGRTTAIVLFGVASTVGIVAFTMLRNYIHFHNPLWPDLRVEIPEWNIHWPGNYIFDDPSLPTGEQVNADIPWIDFWKKLFALPFSVSSGHDWQIVDYGVGVGFALIPLGLVIFGLTVVEGSFKLVFRRFCRDAEERKSWAALLRLVIPVVATIAASPAPYIGRYHLAIIALAAAIVAAYGGVRRCGRLTEGIMAVVAVGSIATVGWNTRGWVQSPESLLAMAKTPPPMRYLMPTMRPAIRLEAGLARERELHEGDVVVFERIAFVALLWNDHYTNRVVWTEDFRDPLLKARELGARWIYAGRGGWFDTHAAMPGSGWQRIDLLETEGFGNVYRRVPPVPALPRPVGPAAH